MLTNNNYSVHFPNIVKEINYHWLTKWINKTQPIIVTSLGNARTWILGNINISDFKKKIY